MKDFHLFELLSDDQKTTLLGHKWTLKFVSQKDYFFLNQGDELAFVSFFHLVDHPKETLGQMVIYAPQDGYYCSAGNYFFGLLCC